MCCVHKYKLIALLLAVFSILPVTKVTANTFPVSELTFIQPDGSRFQGRMVGDQFLHYAVDQNGAILIQEDDGWWCYAQFDEDAHFQSTGVHVGQTGSAGVKSGQTTEVRYVTEVPQALKDRACAKRGSIPRRDYDFSLQMNAETGTLQSGGTRSASATKSATPTVIRGLVLLAEFQDTTFRNTRQDFDDLINKAGYSYQGAEGCAKDYFTAQLGEDVVMEFHVAGPYKLSQTQAYYGENDANGEDKHAPQMIVDVCQKADSDVDFSLYDMDNDGAIDNVFVFYSGLSEAKGGGKNAVWPHSWYVWSGASMYVSLDGKLLDRYACSSELEVRGKKSERSGIGTFCHEFSHVLGLVDLYDTDYNKDAQYCGSGCYGMTALMDAGNNNNDGNTPPNYNAIDRILISGAGIVSPSVFPDPVLLTEGEYRLHPVSDGGTVYFAHTDKEGEYFLFECRDNTTGWDKYIGGRGLLVYHFDMSDNLTGTSRRYKDGSQLTAYERWWYNEVNARFDCQCGNILPAGSMIETKVSYNIYSGHWAEPFIERVFFPQGASSFSAANGFEFRSGQSSDLALSNIRMDGKDVLFTVNKVQMPPFVTESRFNAVSLQDCQIYFWDLGGATDAVCTVRLSGYGDNSSFGTIERELTPYAPGKYSVLFDGLEPQKAFKVEIFYTKEGLVGKMFSKVMTTMKQRVGDGTPFISLKGTARNSDGSFTVDSAFPLRLVNARDAMSVEWYYNGKAVNVDESLLFLPGRSGVLKAVLRDKDGVETIISKQINIR